MATVSAEEFTAITRVARAASDVLAPAARRSFSPPSYH
jgi:hypothetical protein